MNKVLVEMYLSYGKGKHSGICETFIGKDTSETRKEAIEFVKNEYVGNFYYKDIEQFLNKETNKIYFDKRYSWENVERGYVTITTYEDKLKTIEENYKKDIDRLNKLFNEGNDEQKDKDN